MEQQLPFDFSASPSNGLESWRARRRTEMEELAHAQGLPLGHRVRVDLQQGPSLEGLLLLNEETLFAHRPDVRLHLRIGTSDFQACEVAACVRLD